MINRTLKKTLLLIWIINITQFPGKQQSHGNVNTIKKIMKVTINDNNIIE